MQGDLQAARDHVDCANGGRKSQTAANVDAAVAQLIQMQQQGRLQGRLLGRICDLAVINQVEASTAVNAVLSDSCNLVC